MLKATLHNLKKLETIYKESGYRVRYGKGNFQAGYCILDDQYQIVVNKFYSIEIKMGILTDLLTKVNLDVSKLSDGSLKAIEQQKVSLEAIGENRAEALAADEEALEAKDEETQETETEEELEAKAEESEEVPETKAEEEPEAIAEEEPEAEEEIIKEIEN